MTCSVCTSTRIEKFLSLGHQPPSDAFLTQAELDEPEVTYPLDLYFCPDCSLVQLGYAVDPDILFRDYVYNTSTNNSLRSSFKALAEEIMSIYRLAKGDFVVDIGSNDGTLLENFIPHGVQVLGIDPSSSTSIAVEHHIPTLVDYFTLGSAQKVLKEYGKATIITATNVFRARARTRLFYAGDCDTPSRRRCLYF